MARRFPPRSQPPAESSPPLPTRAQPTSTELTTPDQTQIEWSTPQPLPPLEPGIPGLPPRPIEVVLAEEERQAPSLPIILISAAVGMVAGVSTYFILQQIFSVRIEWSVAAAVLALCFGLGATGGILSAAMGSRAAVPNILFSCGVILLASLFLALCMVIGALGATFMLFLQGS